MLYHVTIAVIDTYQCYYGIVFLFDENGVSRVTLQP